MSEPRLDCLISIEVFKDDKKVVRKIKNPLVVVPISTGALRYSFWNRKSGRHKNLARPRMD